MIRIYVWILMAYSSVTWVNSKKTIKSFRAFTRTVIRIRVELSLKCRKNYETMRYIRNLFGCHCMFLSSNYCMIFFDFSCKTRMYNWSWMPGSSCMHTRKMSEPLLHHYMWSQCWMQGDQTSCNLLLQTRVWGRSIPYLWRT